MKTSFGYWLCSWVWLFGMIASVLSFAAIDGFKWGYALMDWLDEHGFEMWVTLDEVKAEEEK